MTTEIAILNRGAVALAADSALTIGRDRVWKSGNKLFSLGPTNDIAVMFYGLGDFIGYPWETIVKCFRERTGNKAYGSVKECSADFFDYIRSDLFKHEANENLSLDYLFVVFFEILNKSIVYERKMEFRKVVADEVLEHLKIIESMEVFDNNITLPVFSREFSKRIKDLASDVFEQKITNELHKIFVNYCFELARREVTSKYHTGVVFAGFGKDQMFPYAEHFIVDGKCKGIFRSWSVDISDLNNPNESPGIIVPFGQTDVVFMFMEGINESYIEFIEKIWLRFLNTRSEEVINSYIKEKDERTVELSKQKRENIKVMESFLDQFSKLRNKQHSRAITNIVSSLPKDEMAAMAEAMVELTSLRRKVDSRLESVGGPVDVAIISKGDGLIWTKRKHYFNMELNSDYAVRKRLRREAP
ncbi:hypothetical protein ACMDCR_22455 [Labrys okinawensis]|uniref:hypothetical protein n=1 Tax=Labrys okinawensis TaxID=346911 RepID=UPI0039BD454E